MPVKRQTVHGLTRARYTAVAPDAVVDSVGGMSVISTHCHKRVPNWIGMARNPARISRSPVTHYIKSSDWFGEAWKRLRKRVEIFEHV
jgi:hypothetical protein